MQFFLFLFSSILQLTIANLSAWNEGDVNLFLDPTADFLPSDDSWSVASEDPTLNQLSLDDASLDASLDPLDWTDSVELAQVDDFCAAQEDFPLVGRVRARNGEVCKPSDQNTDLPALPELLPPFDKPPEVNPTEESQDEGLLSPVAGPNPETCISPYLHHLCCKEPPRQSREVLTSSGLLLWDGSGSCDPGKRLCHYQVQRTFGITSNAAIGYGTCVPRNEFCCQFYRACLNLNTPAWSLQ